MRFISTTSHSQNGTALLDGIFKFRTKLANRVRKRINSRIARDLHTDRQIWQLGGLRSLKPTIERISRLQCLGDNGLEGLRTSRNKNRYCRARADCKQPAWTSHQVSKIESPEIKDRFVDRRSGDRRCFRAHIFFSDASLGGGDSTAGN